MIVVFGGNGQLGRELAEAASSRSLQLATISHREVDVADAERVRYILRRLAPSIVVNAAAFTDVERAEAEPDAAHRTNAEGARIIAAACRQVAIPLVHISTDFVFDGKTSATYLETDEVHPLNVYGRSKAFGEAYVMAEADHYAIIRTSWLFSRYGRNFVKTILAQARERNEITVVDDQFGCPTPARRLAAAVLDAAPRLCSDRALSGIYHFAGTPVTSWHAFATDIISAQAASTGRTPRVFAIASSNYNTRARRPMNSALDCTKIKRVFGIQAPDWRPEVANTVNALVAATRADDVA